MKKIIIALALVILGVTRGVAEHTTTLKLPRLLDGQIVTLINYDNGEVLDSLEVKNETVVFPSNRFSPCKVSIMAGDTGYGDFLLSDADINLDVKVEDIEHGVRWTWESYGGYNDGKRALLKELEGLNKEYHEAETKEKKNRIFRDMKDFWVKRMMEHADDILGYDLLLGVYKEMSIESLDSLLTEHPALKEYEKVKEALDSKRQLIATQPGNKFKDFTVTYKDESHSLGDVVGKGDYVLLDFWAIWCRPCLEEMPNIKEVYNRYKDNNFKVVGVAVSGDPERTFKLAASRDLSWDIWIDETEAASKAYIVNTIPHLILFGPDGTILERGFRGKDIIETVSKYLDAR